MPGQEPSEPNHVGTTPRSRIVLAVRTGICALTATPLLRWAIITHAVRAGRPWRRSCPRCASQLGPRGDLLALSPLARCGRCGQRLGPPPWTLELVAALSAAMLIWSGMRGLPLIAYGWWAAVSIVLAFVDLAVQRLPARLSYAATSGLILVFLADALLTHNWRAWDRAVLGALITVIVVAVCALAVPGLVHWGDVRYSLAIGAAAAWVGWLGLYAAAFLATLFGALVGIGLIIARRARLTSHLAQGPFWYAGTLFAIILLHM
jgi:leader peptidase (prepilin peptidase)/N-methyltransferase